jgi:hypothetical protein
MVCDGPHWANIGVENERVRMDGFHFSELR